LSADRPSSQVYTVMSRTSKEVDMSIPRSIERFLGEQHMAYSVIPHRPAYTAQEEAAAAHVPGRQWAKTVACIADDRPILAVVPAPARIDLDRLREIASADDVRLATEREFERLYPDCEMGAMPPLGPLYGQPVFVDRALASGHEIVFDAGSHSNALKMRYDDFARVVHPTVGDFGRV
jgi:Ala-tRNA(Pro) deacylase